MICQINETKVEFEDCVNVTSFNEYRLPVCSITALEEQQKGEAELETDFFEEVTPLSEAEFKKLLQEETIHLEKDRTKQIMVLIRQHKQVVSYSPELTDVYVHDIKIKSGCKPVMLRQYRLSLKHQALLNIEIDKLMSAGIIHGSKSEWSSPAILMGKADGGV